MSREIVKHYTHDGVTLVWQPGRCIHSRRCFQALPEVFNPSRRPWVDLAAAPMEAIIQQVARCPSRALSITRQAAPQPVAAPCRADLLADGPLILKGELILGLPDGSEQACQGTTAFCRCGASGRKPFCDGSHQAAGFKG